MPGFQARKEERSGRTWTSRALPGCRLPPDPSRLPLSLAIIIFLSASPFLAAQPLFSRGPDVPRNKGGGFRMWKSLGVLPLTSKYLAIYLAWGRKSVVSLQMLPWK